jgi:hypothetical protein
MSPFEAGKSLMRCDESLWTVLDLSVLSAMTQEEVRRIDLLKHEKCGQTGRIIHDPWIVDHG